MQSLSYQIEGETSEQREFEREENYELLRQTKLKVEMGQTAISKYELMHANGTLEKNLNEKLDERWQQMEEKREELKRKQLMQFAGKQAVEETEEDSDDSSSSSSSSQSSAPKKSPPPAPPQQPNPEMAL